MDDVVGGLAAAVAALVEALVNLVSLGVELLALLLEWLLWGILALFGRPRDRPQRRHFGRGRRGLGSLLGLGVLAVAAGLAYAGHRLHRDVLTAPVSAESTTGWPVDRVEVEWIEDGGDTRPGTIEGRGTRYWKWSWDRVRIVDERYAPETIELTGEAQRLTLVPVGREAVKQKLAGGAIDAGGRLLEKWLAPDPPEAEE